MGDGRYRNPVPIPVPHDLRDAVADGWTGLTLSSDRGSTGRPLLVCAESADRLGALRTGVLTVGVPPPDHPRAGRLLMLGVTARDDAVVRRLSVDLGHVEARRLMGWVAADGAVAVLWLDVARGSGERQVVGLARRPASFATRSPAPASGT
jgi:hypothetical protein